MLKSELLDSIEIIEKHNKEQMDLNNIQIYESFSESSYRWKSF